MKYDLEERAGKFALRVRQFVRRLPQNPWNREDAKQVIRSSGSIGANYLEANESLGRKDFAHRIKISKKEARETAFWLRILDIGGSQALEQERALLLDEAGQFVRILAAILKKLGT